jgi:hypothetical protein
MPVSTPMRRDFLRRVGRLKHAKHAEHGRPDAQTTPIGPASRTGTAPAEAGGRSRIRRWPMNRASSPMPRGDPPSGRG